MFILLKKKQKNWQLNSFSKLPLKGTFLGQLSNHSFNTNRLRKSFELWTDINLKMNKMFSKILLRKIKVNSSRITYTVCYLTISLIKLSDNTLWSVKCVYCSCLPIITENTNFINFFSSDCHIRFKHIHCCLSTTHPIESQVLSSPDRIWERL